MEHHVSFEAFPKIPRLRRNAVVTEKIDGTNAAVVLTRVQEAWAHLPIANAYGVTAPDGTRFALQLQSRNRFLTPDSDNFGFAAWAYEHAEGLVGLGEGRHFGEWYGLGIQRGYGLDEKRFALFNTGRWSDDREADPDPKSKLQIAPACCEVVPVLGVATYSDVLVELAIWELMNEGSKAVPGFMEPEGVVVYHTASRQTYKRLIEGDEVPKSLHNYHSEESVA